MSTKAVPNFAEWVKLDLSISTMSDSLYAELAYNYAMYVSKKRFFEAESTIAKYPKWAYYYAMDLTKERFWEAEAAIAESEFKNVYLCLFPEAKDDWILNGWLDWLDT